MIILRSLSFRLASTYAILFAASVSAMLSAFYWVNVYYPIQKVEERIQVEADELTDMLIVDGQDATLRRLERLARSSEKPLFIAAYKNPQGVWTLFNILALPELPPADWVKIEADIYKSGLEEDRLALLKISRLRNGAVLLTGRDIARHEDISEKTRDAAGWIIPLTLILSVVGGYLMSRAIGLRVDRITRTAHRVIDGDLTGRVPLTGSSDDFDRLSYTLNSMFERLERSFNAVRRVSDHVAHELKTPLARVAGELASFDEESLSREPRLERVKGEIDRLSRVIEALLRIARIESGQQYFVASPVMLGDLLYDVSDYYRPQAEAFGLALEVSVGPRLKAEGDLDLLFQAVANLVDNAIKFSGKGAGTTVILSAAMDGSNALLSVCDDGIGVQKQHLAKLGERFYRAENGINYPGDGLGLSLVVAVARAHGGSLTFTQRDPGLCATISIPASCRQTVRREG